MNYYQLSNFLSRELYVSTYHCGYVSSREVCVVSMVGVAKKKTVEATGEDEKDNKDKKEKMLDIPFKQVVAYAGSYQYLGILGALCAMLNGCIQPVRHVTAALYLTYLFLACFGLLVFCQTMTKLAGSLYCCHKNLSRAECILLLSMLGA